MNRPFPQCDTLRARRNAVVFLAPNRPKLFEPWDTRVRSRTFQHRGMVSSDYLPTYANLPHFQYAQLRVTDLNLFPRRVALNQTTDPTEGCPWCPVLFNIHAVSVPNRNPHLNSPLVRLEGSLRYLGQILLPFSCARDLNQASSSANIPKFDQVRRVSPWRARPIGPSVGHLRGLWYQPAIDHICIPAQ